MLHVPAILLWPDREQPRNPCIVTTAYLCRLYQLVGGGVAPEDVNYLTDDIIDRLRELMVQAGCAGGSEDLQRLRGFFCMGVMLLDCVHPIMRRRRVYDVCAMLPPRPEFGWEDLTNLLAHIKQLEDELIILDVQRALRGAFRAKHLEPQAKKILDATAQAAIVLRRSLRVSAKLNGVRMGRLLANAQHAAGVTADKMLSVVPHLLRVSEERTWTLKNYPVSLLLSSPRS